LLHQSQEYRSSRPTSSTLKRAVAVLAVAVLAVAVLAVVPEVRTANPEMRAALMVARTIQIMDKASIAVRAACTAAVTPARQIRQ